MKKIILSILAFFVFIPIFSLSVFAAQQDTLRVGLYFDGSGTQGALLSANLENAVGSGYQFGYYDNEQNFISLGSTDETQISMSKDVNIYLNGDGSYTESEQSGTAIGCFHLQLNESFPDFDTAAVRASEFQSAFGNAFPAYDRGQFYVRIGSYLSNEEALEAQSHLEAASTVNSGTGYTVMVTRTKTDHILFEYDDGGNTFLAVQPIAPEGEAAVTWFKGYRYHGGFEYDRSPSLSSGWINVINVVATEDYVKGVVPFEMSASWPVEALKAQAVCARSYALCQHKHDSKNFNVCSTTNCQTYHGIAREDENSNTAVDQTAGLKLYYEGSLIEPPYYSSNGGATENSENVWYTPLAYLRGKTDPYEGTIDIPNYTYEKTYTGAELGNLLRKKGHTVHGKIVSVAPSYTKSGNMYSIVFTDETGNRVEVKKENCRLLLGARSMHFTITSGSQVPVVPKPDTEGSRGFYVNGGETFFEKIKGLFFLDSSGKRKQCDTDSVYVITADGKSALGGKNSVTQTTAPAASSGDVFTVRGAGNGHNVGMSQYGAKAMALQGKTFEEILHFYYTGVTIE